MSIGSYSSPFRNVSLIFFISSMHSQHEYRDRIKSAGKGMKVSDSSVSVKLKMAFY